MKQDIENIIKKNLPEEKIISNIKFNSIQEDYSCGLLEGEILGHNQCLSQINPSLIADEVLKVVKNEMHQELNKYLCENLDLNNLGNEELRNDILQLLSNLSPNKENKNNERRNN